MSNKISNIEIYERLWKCRDFEIDHVWQRAVFLSAFLLACYAGYGTLIMGWATAENLSIPFRLANVIAFIIACVGLILSLVWIMMAKGSKAWYEHYEKAIEAFESYKNGIFENSASVRVIGIHKVWGFERPVTSSWLWNTKGGAYSVAKINIVIGHVSTVIWLGIIGIHLLIIKKNFMTAAAMMQYFESNCDFKTIVFMFVFTLLLFWLYSVCSIRSSFLKDTI